MNTTIPTKKERNEARSEPRGGRSVGSREWVIQGIYLASAFLSARLNIAKGHEVLREIKELQGYKTLGYTSHRAMLDAEGLTAAIKATKAVQAGKADPTKKATEIADEIGAHRSTVSRALEKEGIRPSTKMDEVRKYLKTDGSPVDDPATGKPYSLRAVARMVGCSHPHALKVVTLLRCNKVTTPRPAQPSPLDAIKKAILALSDADWQALVIWRNTQ